MRTLLVGSMLVLLLCVPRNAAAQVPIVAGEDLSVALTGRIQTQFNTSTADSVASTFELRRARVGVELLIDEWIEGRAEWNFAHGARLEDGYVNLAFHDAFQVQAGQFKKPFSRIELISSSRIVPIEAGLRIRGLEQNAEHYLLLEENVYVGREIGAQVHGGLGPLGYAFGVFNGSDQNNRDDNDAKSFAGRLELEPFARLPLEIGGGASYRDVATVDSAGDPITEEGLAVGVDVAWGGFRRTGPSLVAEVMRAENFAAADPMIGGQAVLSWFQPLAAGRVEGVEPLFRASYGDPSTEFDGNAGLLMTPGINLYFHGRNRLMVNWDYFQPEHDDLDAEHAIRGQLQLFF